MASIAPQPVLLLVALAAIVVAIVVAQSNATPRSAPLPAGLQPIERIDGASYPAAPEFAGISGRINASESLTMESLRGKVVLVDFWTYSCINCIRTIPYLKQWNEKYAPHGLVIVGLHAPEFEFEKDYDNVKRAVEKHGIQYAVLQDNDFITWRLYNNHYWPHKYLIDAHGKIRYDHIGEGAYEETEKKIVELLNEAKQTSALQATPTVGELPEFGKIGTPEIYLGYGFARAPIGNPEGLQPEHAVLYSAPAELQPNIAHLSGAWKSSRDYVELEGDRGSVFLRYNAKSCNIVASGKSRVAVKGFGQPLNASDLGIDATLDGNDFVVDVSEERLYNVMDSESYGERSIELAVHGKGFRLYSFTFG